MDWLKCVLMSLVLRNKFSVLVKTYSCITQHYKQLFLNVRFQICVFKFSYFSVLLDYLCLQCIIVYLGSHKQMRILVKK